MGLDLFSAGLTSSQVSSQISTQLGTTIGRPWKTGGTSFYAPASSAAANTVLVQNTLYAMPFFIPIAATFSKLGVVTTGVASSAARLGIYADVNGSPGTRIVDGGSVATTAGGFFTVTINQALSQGWVWLACAVQGAAGNLNSVTSGQNLGFVPVLAPFSTGPLAGYSKTGVSGALPDPFGAVTDANVCPIVYIAPA